MSQSDNDLQVQLKEGVDYKASYIDNIGAGTAAVVVTGIGNYKGTKTFGFSIVPADIGGAKITGVRSLYGYTGGRTGKTRDKGKERKHRIKHGF